MSTTHGAVQESPAIEPPGSGAGEIVVDQAGDRSAPSGGDQTSANPRSDDRQEDATLVFAFEGAHWRAVLGWLAEEADFELHVGDLPTGSFTYSGTRLYTPNEAIERLNVFLIPKGFTLVRSGRLLSVISLDDERSVRQLDALAERVTTEQLGSRPAFDVVKCLFSLKEADPADVLQEISGISVMGEPVVLPRTNQLLVIGTAGKLRTIQTIIESIQNPGAEQSPVKQFQLQHVTADAVLAVARPLLGMEPDAMTGGDISIAVDSTGKQLFAHGQKEKLDILQSVLRMVDVQSASARTPEPLIFDTHPVPRGNLQLAYDVLVSLLADEDVQLAQEPTTNRLAIRATPRVHELVRETLSRLRGDNVQFEIIDLGGVDPHYAVMLIKEMFDIKPDYLISDDEDEDTPSGAGDLQIDADPLTMRLFVRGTGSQIEEIRGIIQKLQPRRQVQDTSRIRLLPYSGKRGREILEAARRFWPDDNELLILPAAGSEDSGVLERAISSPPAAPGLLRRPRTDPFDRLLEPSARDRDEGKDAGAAAEIGFGPVTGLDRPGAVRYTRQEQSGPSATSADDQTQRRQPPAILGQLTTEGILVRSQDPDALDRFEEHIRLIAGPARSNTKHFRVLYLSHERAVVANRLLAELLDGWISSAGTMHGSLFADSTDGPMVDTFGSGLLDNVRTSGGSVGNILTADSVTIVADARLNRLFVSGTLEDIAKVERHLQIIDRESGLAEIRTHGRPHVIKLKYSRAEEVAAIVRDAYAIRMAGGAPQQPQQANQKKAAAQLQAAAAQQANPQGNEQNKNKSSKQQGQSQGQPQQPQQQAKGQKAQPATQEPRMTIAVDGRSNSIVVTAPEHLAREVEELVRVLDENGAQSIHLVRLKHSSPAYIRNALSNIFGDRMAPGSAAPAAESGAPPVQPMPRAIPPQPGRRR